MGNPSKKILIINADDFGLLPEVNQGIIECFESGSITSTTLMVNMEGGQDAVEQAKKHPTLGVGFHFTLTQGKPLSSKREIPTLVNGDGNFYPRGQLEKRIIMGKVAADDLKKEFLAQIEGFKQWGLEMTHIDSHHHIHMFPIIFKIVSDYAHRTALPLRIPWVSYGFATPTLNLNGIKSLIKKMLLKALTFKLSYTSLKDLAIPDAFLSVYDYIPFPQRICAHHYLDLINSAPKGTTELMVHPARVTSKLECLFSNAFDKEQERAVLTDLPLIKYAEKYGFKVSSYKETALR